MISQNRNYLIPEQIVCDVMESEMSTKNELFKDQAFKDYMKIEKDMKKHGWKLELYDLDSL